jgi:hypothetical protein
MASADSTTPAKHSRAKERNNAMIAFMEIAFLETQDRCLHACHENKS